jgi:hypothetical protein
MLAARVIFIAIAAVIVATIAVQAIVSQQVTAGS